MFYNAYASTTASSITTASWAEIHTDSTIGGGIMSWTGPTQRNVIVNYTNCTDAYLNFTQIANLNVRDQNGLNWNAVVVPQEANTNGVTFRILDYTTAHPAFNITAQFVDGKYLIATEDLSTRIKNALKMRLAPRIFTHAKPLGFTKDMREIRARKTLHRVLGDDKYKNFLRKGFISIQAKSGLIYQIYPGHDFTKVYHRGQIIDRYCVVLSGSFPPTDSLIMRYLMILNNEEAFKSLAVKHGIGYIQPAIVQQDNRSLLEIFKEFKRAA